MDLGEFVRVCRAYAYLGTAIQEQLDVVLDDEMTDDNINEAALDYIEDWLNEAAVLDGDLEEEIERVIDRIDAFRDEMADLVEEGL